MKAAGTARPSQLQVTAGGAVLWGASKGMAAERMAVDDE